MPAIKVNSNRNSPMMLNPEVEKTKAQIKALASDIPEGPGQERFLDVYLLEMVRLQEASMDDQDMALCLAANNFLVSAVSS